MSKSFLSSQQNIRILRESFYSGIFALLMLGLISPFNVGDLGDRRYGYFILVSLCTMVVAILSGLFTAYVLRMPLDPKLPLGKLHRNSAMIYAVNTPVLAAVLTTLNGAYNCDHALDIWWWQGHFTLVPYSYFLYYVASTSVLMYAGMYVRNRNWHLHTQLDEMRMLNKLLEEHQDRAVQEPIGSAASEREKEREREKEKEREKENEKGNGNENENENENGNGNGNDANAFGGRLCRLEGDTRDSVLEVNTQNILYVESMANYANIWYMDGDTAVKKTLRITLKQIKENLHDAPFLVQCHRAFVVNLDFVLSVSSRQNGYQLRMFGTDCSVPVSRTYLPMIKERLRSKQA